MCGAAAQAGEYTGSYSNRSLGPLGSHGYYKIGDREGGFIKTANGWVKDKV